MSNFENANIVISIDGVEIDTKKNMLGGLIIQDSVDSYIPECNFTLRPPFVREPREDMTVIVYDTINMRTLFAGFIFKVDLSHIINSTEIGVNAVGYKKWFYQLTSQISLPPAISFTDAVKEIVLHSTPTGQGLGPETYNIQIGEVDDFQEFDYIFEQSTPYGSAWVGNTLDYLATISNSYWYVDNAKKFYFKRLNNSNVFVPDFEINETLEEYLKRKQMTEVNLNRDATNRRNVQYEYAKQINTSIRQLTSKVGQRENREYAMSMPVSKELKVEVSKDGGLTYIEESVGTKNFNDTGGDAIRQWYFAYNDEIVVQDERGEQFSPNTLIRFTYIGVYEAKGRYVNEQAIYRRSNMLGVPRALNERFDENDQANTQKELDAIGGAKLIQNAIAEVEFVVTTKKYIGLLPSQSLNIDVNVGGIIVNDILFCSAVNINIYKNIDNQLINTTYTYTFIPKINFEKWFDYWRKNQKQNYNQNSDIVDMIVDTGASQISIEVETIELVNMSGNWYPSATRFPSDNLYVGTVQP